LKEYKDILVKSFLSMLRYLLHRGKYYSVNYINKIVKEIYQAISMLKIFPYATPSIKFKNKPGEYRKYVINNRFLIIFKIEQNNVYLLYFVDARMQYENYFKIHVD